ncbi:MAG: hypothetical protein AAFP17_16905 [Pseudomonadota bacterium]
MRTRRFAAGAVVGVVAGLAIGSGGTAFGQTADLIQKVIFTLAELATDIEINSARIVALEEQVDALQAKLEEIAETAQP